ncbi:hypothetical protein FHETE_9138 [Fusarium heterosporum]|uniref:Ribonuclease H1 N-terminal domain-containing protein n=1 Tax=Fusarium heterosporum TaxID=42747 RepID=A0A8H5T098_FUSHE|nr:hypothetical protein FHETE_9138 [Fusarium heterosporum]
MAKTRRTWYAIGRGAATGIATDWGICASYTNGFRNPVRKFASEEEARQWLCEIHGPGPWPLITKRKPFESSPSAIQTEASSSQTSVTSFSSGNSENEKIPQSKKRRLSHGIEEKPSTDVYFKDRISAITRALDILDLDGEVFVDRVENHASDPDLG